MQLRFYPRFSWCAREDVNGPLIRYTCHQCRSKACNYIKNKLVQHLVASEKNIQILPIKNSFFIIVTKAETGILSIFLSRYQFFCFSVIPAPTNHWWIYIHCRHGLIYSVNKLLKIQRINLKYLQTQVHCLYFEFIENLFFRLFPFYSVLIFEI